MTKIPKPSEMMRSKRPYLYSDSENTDAYRLSASELSHHLDTITDRNQHKDFEIFARKLCEREICPNLRPQTGPEGGGDGKVDSESFPVDGKISERWFVASARDGKEKWAFAVSARKSWSSKVRSDVEGIINTKRNYNKIIFVTNRPTRAKVRLRIEDELTEQYGVPVTILDREWIVDRVFTNDHKDLSHEQLGAGEHDSSSVKLGPNDFKNQQALDEIENALINLGNEPSDYTQAVKDTFEAANLSRRLERPKFETEGRFIRAIDFAKKYGANYQELRAVYGQAWTRFWWFNDVHGMQELYERVEEIAFDTNHAEHISKVCNLHQLLTSQILHYKYKPEELQFEERSKRLRVKLNELSTEKSRPNNALYSETLLIFHDLNAKLLEGKFEAFDQTWDELSIVVDKARGLGEYPADLPDTMIDALSPFAPESVSFDNLVEKIAEFMADRSKELSAGETYLQHGERKLDANLPVEAIKYLGRAIVNFMKEESREQQYRALYHLAVAYRGAGLLWAARGAALAAIGQISAFSESSSEIPAEIVPSISLFGMIALQSGNIADFLAAIQYLSIMKSHLPLDNENKKRLNEKLVEFDQLASCLFVGLNGSEIERLEKLPDVLEMLGLFNASITLMYRLGYEDKIQDDAELPDEIKGENLGSLMSSIAGQPACKDLPKNIVLLDDYCQFLETRILGIRVRIEASSDLQGYLLSEAHLTYLEAFTSTFLNQNAYGKFENLNVKISEGVSNQSSLEFIPEGSKIVVKIPKSWDATQIDNHTAFMQHLTKFGALVLASAFTLIDYEKTLDEILGIERAFDRATLFSRVGITRNRFFGSYAGQLSDWNQFVQNSYEQREDAPQILTAVFPEPSDSEQEQESIFEDLKSHDQISVSSIINEPLWDKARWSGMGYGYSPDGESPIIGLVFNDAGAAKAIFREWRERFGKIDEKDAIRISIVKGIDAGNPFHYRGCVGFDPDVLDKERFKRFVSISRLTTMMVDNHTNLETFLENLKKTGFYYLAPAVTGANGLPEFVLDLAIAKSKFQVREAWKIGMHDIDSMGVTLKDNVIIPDGEENAPITELLKWKQSTTEKGC